MSFKPWHLVSLGAVAIAMLVGLHLLATLSGPSSPEVADAIADAKTWVQVAKGWHGTRIALQAREDVHADSARAAADSAATHHAADVARDAELVHAQTAADSVPVLVAQRDAARAEAASWHDAFLELGRAKAVADSALAHADSIIARGRAITAAVTKVADCRILGVKFFPRCLSRMHSFEAGALIATVLIVAKPVRVHL